jgi:hypothetical protein
LVQAHHLDELLGAATAACCVTGLGAIAGLRSLAETRRLAGV